MSTILPDDPSSTIDPLPEDNSTPFSEPDVPVNDAAEDTDRQASQPQLNPDDPRFDTAISDIDTQEVLDAGATAAAEGNNLPNPADSVAGYDPDKDQRRQDDSTATSDDESGTQDQTTLGIDENTDTTI